MVMEGFERPFTYMGYYQDVDREVDLEAMERYDVEIVRRWKLGYGNIFMDKVTGAWAFAAPQSFYERYIRDVGEAFDVLVGKIFLETVKAFGVKSAYYAPPNDIRVRDRLGRSKKLCGTGVDIAGGPHGRALYFNAFTNLSHPDPELPFKVLRIPPEKIAEKGFTSPREYFASLEMDGSGPPSPGEFMEVLVEKFEEILGVKVEEARLSLEEERVWSRYLEVLKSDDFKFRRSTRRFMESMPPGARYGFAQIKYRKLVQGHVAVEPGGTIRAAMITGDFQVIPADADEEFAQLAIGRRPGDYEEAAREARRLVEERGYVIVGATPEDFIKPLFKAAEEASGRP
jgi:lipoate-protein ligase A